MARAHGARAQMALAFESVYGTAPATGYRTVPFASTTLGSEQPLIASELLGQGRDPLAPIKDAVTADGDVVVPIDVENLGLWLKAAFGAPVIRNVSVGYSIERVKVVEPAAKGEVERRIVERWTPLEVIRHEAQGRYRRQHCPHHGGRDTGGREGRHLGHP